MGLEAKYTAPLVGLSSAASRCNNVLFPAPDGATMATISPRRKLKLASAKTVKDRDPAPYVFRKPRASSITGDSGTPYAVAAPASDPELASELMSSPHFPMLLVARLSSAAIYLDAGTANPVPNLTH